MSPVFSVEKVAFDRTAPYYKYRQPYVEGFFDAIRRKLELSDRSTILDIACGSGEMAVGISPFVHKVIAFDYSQDMLNEAATRPNIDYFLHDLEKAPFLPGTPCDHALIGRAIPYLPVTNLGLTLDNLRSGGRVVISGAIFHRSTSWFREYEAIKNRYRAYRPDKNLFNGHEKMAQLQFQLVDCFSVLKDESFPLEYLAGNVMSIQSCTETILKNPEKFQQELEGLFRPYLNKGMLTGRLSSWANVFARAS